MRVPIALPFAAACLLSTAGQAAEADLQQTVASFLASYAKGDKAAVEAQVDPAVHIYGSDVAEAYSGLAGFDRMFNEDVQLWRGGARFGPMRNVSLVRDATLATIFFDAPFSVGSSPPVPVRFAMAWRLQNGAWKLVQSSNAVPTVGQSAGDLLKPGSK